MKKKNLSLIFGGIVTTLFGFALSRKSRTRRSVDTSRIVDQLNNQYSPPASSKKDDSVYNSYPMVDMPTKMTGGRINLIRAVNDDADARIKEISTRIKEIDAEKSHLLVELEAHTEMLSVARKYVNKLTVTVTK